MNPTLYNALLQDYIQDQARLHLSLQAVRNALLFRLLLHSTQGCLEKELTPPPVVFTPSLSKTLGAIETTGLLSYEIEGGRTLVVLSPLGRACLWSWEDFCQKVYRVSRESMAPAFHVKLEHALNDWAREVREAGLDP